MDELLGKALFYYYFYEDDSPLFIYNRYDDLVDEMDPAWYFREWEDWPPFEQQIIERAKGKVLDIGAGVGSHCLELQNRGFEVTALEVNPDQARIAYDRGVKQVVTEDIYQFHESGFDTFLLIMNGFGLARSRAGLLHLLRHIKTLANSGAKILADSSNIGYLLEQMEIKPPAEHYLGEWGYAYNYQGEEGEWDTWLYVDQDELREAANQTGWQMEVIAQDDMDAFLVELSLP